MIHCIKYIAYFLILCCLNFNAAMAQLNESDTAKFQLNTSLSGNYQSGNVNVLIIRGKHDMALSVNKHFVFKTQNATLFQSFSSRKADNDLFSRNFLYYNAQSRLYPFAIVFISSNFRRKIKDRYFAGIGATCQAIRMKHNLVKLSFNVVYENTDFDATQYNYESYNGSKQIKLWRSTLYLSAWHFIGQKKVKVFYEAYYQPSWHDRKNYRTQLDLGINIPMWNGLSFTVLYTAIRENVVAIKVNQKDKILTFGLNYALKKIH
jgi:hypothetical protein